MNFTVLRPVAPPLERRYDGPVPHHTAPSQTPSGLLERLAAECRAQTALRRQGLAAAQIQGDDGLARRCRSLLAYRQQAVHARYLTSGPTH